MKVLEFVFRGETYLVNEEGHINANGINKFSKTWIFLGGSSHHWHTHITVTLKDAFDFPGMLNGCLGWDADHGTVSQWRGQYYGRLPRINNAHVYNTSPYIVEKGGMT